MLFLVMILVSLLAELLVSNRALVVHYEGTYYFDDEGQYFSEYFRTAIDPPLEDYLRKDQHSI